ncbi:hypothetical protein BJ170DRAFT_592383 [Xylariales sp. AK1849]|nr:hypothetical protein BJ170DRAFT_592383 [Xylariales sp. AK1849]
MDSAGRCAARAVGRTPEEHAALELVLARRREEERKAVGRRPVASRKSRTRSTADSSISASNPSSMRCPHPAPRQRLLTRMDRMRALVQDASPAPTPPSVGAHSRSGRRGRVQLSSRSVRGAGWHRRGYRDLGDMWINVKQGTHGCVKGMDVNENASLRSLVREVFDRQGSRYPAGWYCDVFFRKKSLIRMLADSESQDIEEQEVLVRDYFDGGETIYFKVYDGEGAEQDIY